MASSVQHLRQPAPAGADRPLAGYLALNLTYSAGVAALVAAARMTGRRPPERVPLADVVLLGTAAHTLSRLIAKDPVLSWARAPFTRYAGPAGAAEVDEEPRGSGLRRAVGELVSSPFSLSVWVATGLTAGLLFAPRATRLAAATAGAVAVADHLHLGYEAAKAAGRRREPAAGRDGVHR